MSPQAFVDWEERQELGSEFDGFDPVAMTGGTVIDDPVVVFEAFNPSTATTDHIVKNQEYRDTPSIQRYLMLEQDRQAATIFARQGNDWVAHIVSGDVVLAMPEICVDLKLGELYDGVTFADSADTRR